MNKQDAIGLAQSARIVVAPAPGDGTSLVDRLRATLDAEPSPAERHFALQLLGGVVEDELDEALLVALGVDYNEPAAWPCKHITYDFYDSSFELKHTHEDWEPTPAGLLQAWALGFSRCWICYGAGERGDPDYRERYYAVGA